MITPAGNMLQRALAQAPQQPDIGMQLMQAANMLGHLGRQRGDFQAPWLGVEPMGEIPINPPNRGPNLMGPEGPMGPPPNAVSAPVESANLGMASPTPGGRMGQPMNNADQTSTFLGVQPVPANPIDALFADLPYNMPFQGWHSISSDYGPREAPLPGASTNHGGIDFALPEGTPVQSFAEGVVEHVGEDPDGFGTYVVVQHSNGVRSYYGHLNGVDSNIRPGVALPIGGLIGLAGSTGNSTAPHLHFELRHNGQSLDPNQLFNLELTRRINQGNRNAPAQ